MKCHHIYLSKVSIQGAFNRAGDFIGINMMLTFFVAEKYLRSSWTDTSITIAESLSA